MFINYFWRSFLGQNLLQIRNFHNVGRDIRLVGYRIEMMFQVKSLSANFFDEIRILKGRNGLVHLEILRIFKN